MARAIERIGCMSVARDHIIGDFLAKAKTVRLYGAGVDVMADSNSHAVVILGDSITDGRGSTTNGNDRWTDALAQRLQMNASTAAIGDEKRLQGDLARDHPEQVGDDRGDEEDEEVLTHRRSGPPRPAWSPSWPERRDYGTCYR